MARCDHGRLCPGFCSCSRRLALRFNHHGRNVRRPETRDGRSFFVEFIGLELATLAILIALSLVSFNPDDPSFNISTNARFAGSATNFVGVVGSYAADLFFQTWGLSAFLVPIFLGVYAFYWLASWPVKNFWTRFFGMILMTVTLAASLGMSSFHIRDHMPAGGLFGTMLAD